MFHQATKEKCKARLALMGPPGSGKTYTAFLTARVLAGKKGKVAVIDSERGSASKYADLFKFDVHEIEDHSPDNYVKAIEAAEKTKYDVLVIDSMSHEWAGKMGALELKDRATQRSRSKNSFTAWMEVTPKHNRFIDTVLGYPGHLIGTMRTKTKYVMQKNAQGKDEPVDMGLDAIQREGVKYEFDIVGMMDAENVLTVVKTRCPELAQAIIEKPDAAFGKTILAWCGAGSVPVKETLVKSLDATVGDILKYSQEEMEAGSGLEHLTNRLMEFKGEVLVLTGKDKRTMWKSIQGAAELVGTTGEELFKTLETE